MRAKEAFIDTNLLTLLVVGRVDRGLIEKHRRTRNFSVADYDRLRTIIRNVRIFVTPHTLAETSNLLATKPLDKRLLVGLRALIEGSDEITVLGKTAASHRHFPRLGLSDAGLLRVISPQRPLLTVDLDLYQATFENGQIRAYNFRHSRSDSSLV